MSGMVPVARVVKTRGYRGGLWVEPYLENLAPVLNGADVWAGPDEGARPYRVVEYFRYSKGSVLRLDGIETLKAAEPLLGREILVAEGALPKDGALSFDTQEVVGWSVVDESRGTLGEVKDVRRGPAYWLFDVKTARGEMEIPAVTGLGVTLRKEERLVAVNLPAGYPGVDDEAEAK
ncbi:MAG: hypothetical protein JHC34_01845 [Acidobacteria bacterium]|jgi:ribosomal 30S subunit maturation factor RimM|nr:hypothetical protein [Acidobacteriota bacterium]